MWICHWAPTNIINRMRVHVEYWLDKRRTDPFSPFEHDDRGKGVWGLLSISSVAAALRLFRRWIHHTLRLRSTLSMRRMWCAWLNSGNQLWGKYNVRGAISDAFLNVDTSTHHKYTTMMLCVRCYLLNIIDYHLPTITDSVHSNIEEDKNTKPSTYINISTTIIRIIHVYYSTIYHLFTNVHRCWPIAVDSWRSASFCQYNPYLCVTHCYCCFCLHARCYVHEQWTHRMTSIVVHPRRRNLNTLLNCVHI